MEMKLRTWASDKAATSEMISVFKSYNTLFAMVSPDLHGQSQVKDSHRSRWDAWRW
jgi:hypothetical protein